MQDSKKRSFPFQHGITLSKDQTLEEEEHMKRVPYASVIESLMYAMLGTRPKFCYAIGIVSLYHYNHKPKH